APGAGDEEVLAGGVEGQPTDDELLRVGGDLAPPALAQQAFFESEGVHYFELPAGGVEGPAVGRPGQPVEGLVDGDPAGDLLLAGGQIDDDDLVGAVAGVQGGEPGAGGVQREVDGEVAQRELLAGGAEGPLVGQ